MLMKYVGLLHLLSAVITIFFNIMLLKSYHSKHLNGRNVREIFSHHQ